MAGTDGIPEGWTRWTDTPGGHLILVYRPDVFDTDQFPAACLPTITVRPGRVQHGLRRAGDPRRGWSVAVHVEPQVSIRSAESAHDSRPEAVEAAKEVAARFAAGALDYRAAYQVPREDYLDRLDELTGRDA